jgi:hypothetical protein
MRLVLSLAALVLLNACATVTTGTTQAFTVITEPAEAECRLERGGQLLSMIGRTPSSTVIDKSQDDILIVCRRDGHETVSQIVPSTFQGATLGNIILGGGIGVIVDAASGAMNRYPDSATLILPPSSFPSEQERDRFYVAAVESIRQRYQRLIDAERANCGSQSQDACAPRIGEIEGRREAELRDLEGKRLRARIASG